MLDHQHLTKTIKFIYLPIVLFCALSTSAHAQVTYVCGDGFIDPGEECDLGKDASNKSRNDGEHGCNAYCKVVSPANGVSWTCTISEQTYKYNITSTEPQSLRSLFAAERTRNFDTNSPDYILNQKCGLSDATLTVEEKQKCNQFIRDFIRFKDLNYNVSIREADPAISDTLCPSSGLVIKQYNPVTLLADGTYTVLCG